MRRQSPAVRQGGRLTPTRRESSRRQRARPVRSGATHRRPCEKPDENWAGHEKPQLMISSWSIPKELTKKKSPGCSSDGRATCQGQEGRWFKSTHPDDGTHHSPDVLSLEVWEYLATRCVPPPRHTGHPQTWQWPGGLSSIRSRESSQQRCCPGHCRQPKVSCEIHLSGQYGPTQAEPTIDQPASMTKRAFHFSGTINRDE